jgi:hypothetical protein
MPKNSAGYAKAEDKLNEVIKIAQDLKDDWQPLDPNLTVANMFIKKAGIKPLHDAIDAADAVDKLKTKHRAKAYNSLNSVVMRVTAMSKRCKMDATTIDQVQTYKDLVDGSNVAKVAKQRIKKAEKVAKTNVLAVADTEPTKQRSVSKQAFEDRLTNFKLMIGHLTADGTYKTNVKDLTIEALNAYVAVLEAANTATDEADKFLSTKITERSNYIRSKTDSVGSLIKDAKEELLVIEGSTGENFKKMKAIKFMPLKN